jgi:hypothetical protein
MLAALVKETDSLAIHQASMSNIDHEDVPFHESCVDCQQEDNIDYEDSLEVIGDDVLFRSMEADEKSEENRTKRNNFNRQRPAMAQRGHFSRPMARDDDDSLEDMNEKLFKQQRMPTSQHDRKKIVQHSRKMMDTSDEEEPSWEVKDESLKKLGVYWDSIKDMKRNRPSIDDSVEDMRIRQHKVQQLARIGNRHAF